MQNKKQNRFAFVQPPTVLYTPRRLRNRILREKLGLEQCCPRHIWPSCKIRYFGLCVGLCVRFGVWRLASTEIFIYWVYCVMVAVWKRQDVLGGWRLVGVQRHSTKQLDFVWNGESINLLVEGGQLTTTRWRQLMTHPVMGCSGLKRRWYEWRAIDVGLVFDVIGLFSCGGLAENINRRYDGFWLR